MSALQVTDLVKVYRSDNYSVRVLDGLSFGADEGEMAVLLGPSGSGKTTLLSCLGGMLSPTSGSIKLHDTEVCDLSGKALDQYRMTRVGFVFQGFNLIPSLSARENVAIPLLVAKSSSKSEAYARADALLEQVGLADRAKHRPSELSGGQQQRVAVARGLVTDPYLLIADEPTANLDHVQAEAVVRLLRDLRDQGRVIVVSTHDPRLAPVADQVVEMAPAGESTETAPSTATFAADQVIFTQGQHADAVYVIEQGAVSIYRDLAEGGTEVLAELGPGQYFGELGAMMGFPRSASAKSIGDTSCTVLGPHEFRKRFESEGRAPV